jgi:hypothetical protein
VNSLEFLLMRCLGGTEEFHVFFQVGFVAEAAGTVGTFAEVIRGRFWGGLAGFRLHTFTDMFNVLIG